MTQWVLPTKSAYYAVSLAPGSVGLVLDGWGESPPPEPWAAEGPLSFETPADAMPLEFSALGTRHVRGAELVVEYQDGLVGARPTDPPQISFDDDGNDCVLSAQFSDLSRRLSWTTVIATSRDHDVVRKWVKIENTGDATVRLPRAFSAAWELPVGPGAQVDYLAGRWSREFTPYQVSLPAGEFRIGSRQGITSHSYSPVVSVSAVDADDAGSPRPSYSVALAWSGSWQLLVDAVPFRERVRISGGLDDESTVIRLEPGERFTSPEMQGVYSPTGAGGLRRRWHDYQRGVLARAGRQHRPIVYNSWYATGFDVSVEHQARLADKAADLGVEVFVVDDGWLSGRHHDGAGLGDWIPDPTKFPDGLSPLITAVQERGMRFGIWVEPEAVNPDSDLYREHPDWVYRAGDRELIMVRNQYVLDFGRPEVVAWAEQMLRNLLADERISYLKWDMNRPVSDGGRPGDPNSREWSVQHARGYYQVMRMLRTEFPHVTVEACAGGGGRIDNAVLGLSDVLWPSDETGPRDRLAIQHGFLSAYPASVMSSWVTDEPDHLDTEPASLEFRFAVAMAGVLGVGADLLAWDEAQRRRATELVRLYTEIREVVHTGLVVPHGNPADSVYVLEYGGVDAHEGTTCLLVYARPSRPDTVRVHPHTLQQGSRYRVRGAELIMTTEEAAAGIEVPFRLSRDTDVLVLERIP